MQTAGKAEGHDFFVNDSYSFLTFLIPIPMKKTALLLLALLPALGRASDIPRQIYIDQVAQCAAWFGLSSLTGPQDSGFAQTTVDTTADEANDPPLAATTLNLALGRLLDGDIERVEQQLNHAIEQLGHEVTRAPGDHTQQLQTIATRYAPGCRKMYRNLDQDMAKWAPGATAIAPAQQVHTGDSAGE